MGLLRADAASEAGAPPTPDMIERMGAFIEEATKAGILLAADGIQPSSTGKRITLENGKHTVRDGPFTESKELIAGYGIYDVKDMAEAIEWTKKFLEVLGRGECEIRPIFEASDFPEMTPDQVAREDATREQMQRNAERG
jgi:hypothetical protein